MKGRITISKVHNCSTREDTIHISIEDELSSIEFVRAEMSLEDFAKAITGQGLMPVEFELRGLKNVGKRLETKTELVYISSSPEEVSSSDQAIREAISEYETDGWIGRDSDAKNHHNWVRDVDKRQVYRIHFCRWVWVEESKLNENKN